MYVCFCLQLEDLDIKPSLVEKYLARKEQRKQEGASGEKPAASKGAATLVVIGLSSGSYTWCKGKARIWIESHGVLLAAFVVAVAVGGVCMFFLNHCT